VLNLFVATPELLNGDHHPKIAVYSFGMIMWEIYTRKIPYHEQHPIRVIPKILDGYRPQVPADCPPQYSHPYFSLFVYYINL
jgi:Protein tyrosine and serine/threonine kinase